MTVKAGMYARGFKDKFEGNYNYLVRNSVNTEAMEKEFNDTYAANKYFKTMADVFAEDRVDVLIKPVSKAAFMMAMWEMIGETRMEKFGNDGARYMVMNLDTQEKQYFQAKSAFEAMSKFKYSMGVKNGKINDLLINKTDSGHSLYMEINGETWACINRKPNGKW